MDFWDLILLEPTLNFLIVLTSVLFSNFGLAIIVLTIIVRLIILPLTQKQLHASKKMSEGMREIQPKLQQLQKKYGKDRAKLQQETMKLYKEAGINPLGCFTSPMIITMLIQMPIWIALYQSIIRLLGNTPEDLLGLSKSLWSWPVVYEMVPLSNNFLWFDLHLPGMPMAVLVGATMWLQQKMVTPNTTDPQQRSQSQLMLWMMPLMFGFLAMSFPSGLSLYWVASNVITIIMQYFIIGGWGGLARSREGREVIKSSIKRSGGGGDIKKRIAQAEQSSGITAMDADIVVESSTHEQETDQEYQDRTKDISYPGGVKTIRHQSKRSKGRRPKKR